MITIKIRKADDTNRVDFWVNGHQYHTNDRGCGCWTGDDYVDQILGTWQFELLQDTRSGMWKAIKKRFADMG